MTNELKFHTCNPSPDPLLQKRITNISDAAQRALCAYREHGAERTLRILLGNTPPTSSSSQVEHPHPVGDPAPKAVLQASLYHLCSASSSISRTSPQHHPRLRYLPEGSLLQSVLPIPCWASNSTSRASPSHSPFLHRRAKGNPQSGTMS
eukprot:IDg11219t1